MNLHLVKLNLKEPETITEFFNLIFCDQVQLNKISSRVNPDSVPDEIWKKKKKKQDLNLICEKPYEFHSCLLLFFISVLHSTNI